MDLPIRVLQVMGTVNYGGIETVTMNYYKFIDKTKIQFDFILPEDVSLSYIQMIKSQGGKIFKVTPYYNNIFKFVYEVYKIIKDNHYSIIHSNMNALSGFPLFAAYMAGARIRILHNHTSGDHREGPKSLIKCILKPFARIFANQFWACSEVSSSWMYGKKIVENHKVTIINNAIEIKKFAFSNIKRDSLKEKFHLEDQFVIGHIGRFVKVKNHKFIINVFNEVHKAKNNTKLFLIGDGNLSQSIKAEVKKLGLGEHVIFLGNKHDVANFYNIMDVFILPSYYEGLPLVGIEAQANGLPIVYSDTITEEMCVGDNVLACNLDDGIKVWSESILKMLTWEREDNSESLKANGFDVSVEAKKLENIYIELRKS